jgi:Domain of unknown function (DUF4145)
MTKARYNSNENNVLARCPNCDAITSFDARSHANSLLGTVIIDTPQTYQGNTYTRVLWQFFRCSVCSRGAVAKLHDRGNPQSAVLAEFLPSAVEKASLPESVPDDTLKEFREAEMDAANGAYRSASAMLRSVLDKTLKRNGYAEVEVNDNEGRPRKTSKLIDRIDAAAEDGIITETRRKRAHENIRVLGNDVLHDDWREVVPEEFGEGHKYAQRILEDFYDDRSTVEARLTAQKRPFVKS